MMLTSNAAGKIPISNSKMKRKENNNMKEKEKEKEKEKKKEMENSKKKPTTARALSSCSTIPDMEDLSFSPSEASAIRSSLLRWYDQSQRLLPWRRRRRPEEEEEPADQEEEENHAYSVWVSEVMLQQTRVAAVVGYYNRWMERWPTVRHLASATIEQVNHMWAGLGYYRRARFLLEGAKSIAERGQFPSSASALREIPGIGDYTSGAIASIAFNEAVPVVDGNVVRVITRLKAISANPKETSTVKTIWRLAGQLVDPSRPGDFNQAVMELGATLCSVTSPSCYSCPVSDQCRALTLSSKSDTVKVTDYPTKVAKAKPRNESAAVCVVEIVQGLLDQESLRGSDGRNSRFILVKRPEEGLLAGLWEFPSVLVEEKKVDTDTRRKMMDKYLKKLFGLDVERSCNVLLREDVGKYVHVFSHIRLAMHVELLILSLRGGANLPENGDTDTISWKCVDGDSIERMGLTSGVRKVYTMAQHFKQPQEVSEQPKRAARKRAERST